MRNMSFSITTPQMYQEIKTLTSRLGWWFLKPGDVLMSIEKGQGLKKGEHVKRIYPIEVLRTYPEPLNLITPDMVICEGFPGKSPEWFIEMFCASHKNCTPETEVNRIWFRRWRDAGGEVGA